jgi:hypothetical protein
MYGNPKNFEEEKCITDLESLVSGGGGGRGFGPRGEIPGHPTITK